MSTTPPPAGPNREPETHAEPAPPAEPGTPPPTVGWGPPPPQGAIPVPGAPGIVFAGTAARFVAYVIDGVLIGLATAVVILPIIAAAGGTPDERVLTIVATTAFVLLDALYFVGFWTSGARATPGMRLLKLQVGHAFDGRPLELDEALRRWFALGTPFQLLGLVPALASISGLVLALWALILLISTVASPTKQGLHDQFAESAVVQPAGQSSAGIVMGCLLLIALLILLSIVSLIFLGGQIRDLEEAR